MLCKDVENLGSQQGHKAGSLIVREFPHYPDPMCSSGTVSVPRVHDAILIGPRSPKQTKEDRLAFNCAQAAVHHLGVPISKLLRDVGLQVCFDSFRAPVTAVLQFDEYFRFTFGCYPAQLASGFLQRWRDLSEVSKLQTVFQRFTKSNSRMAMLDCLAASTFMKRSSNWTVGHFVVFKDGPQHAIYYIGCSRPKIILLVLDDLYGQPSLWMTGAMAYDIPLLGGQNVPKIDLAIERPMQEAACPSLEHKDGNWLLNTPVHVCQQTGCLACFLARIRSIEYCPWHKPDDYDKWHMVNFICAKGCDNSIIRVIVDELVLFLTHQSFGSIMSLIVAIYCLLVPAVDTPPSLREYQFFALTSMLLQLVPSSCKRNWPL